MVSARFGRHFLRSFSAWLTAAFSLIFVFFAVPAGAASYVQSAYGTKLSSEGTPTSVTATIAAPVAGNMLVAVVGANGNVTLSGPAGWSTAINQSGQTSQGVFYKRASGAEAAVSASVSSNPGSIGIHVYEFSGATTFMTSGSNTGNSAAPASGSVTTTVANELVFAAFTVNTDTNMLGTSWNNAGEGFAEQLDFFTTGGGAGPDATYAGGHNLSNAAGAKSVTVSAANSGRWRGQIVRFQNDITPPAAITTLAASNATVSSIQLTWTAPGDDGATGTANTYDLRYSTSPITGDADFNAATQVTGEPTPALAGTVQTMTVTGLSSATLYYFAMKTSDEIPNLSGLSNVPSLATLTPPDTTAPGAVADLSLSNATTTSMLLTWTAPGDDGNTGTAATYDIRRSTAPILSDADFTAATALTGEPSPASSGTSQSMTATGLSPSTTYYFAMKTSDEVPNVSALSNSPGLATLAPPDTTAPATITTLALSGATTTSMLLTWTAPGDDGNTGTAALYDVHYSTSPILTEGDWSASSDVSPSPPAPAIAGTVQSMTATGLSPSTTHYFAIKTYDEVPNISGISNSPGLATLTPPDAVAPAAVTDLELSGATVTSIDLTWTAPGDDGNTGTAALYDIRYSPSPITDGNFGSALQATGEPAPQIVGTVQTMTIGSLNANTPYYFAMKTYDEASNPSSLSNVPSLSTLPAPDTVAPATVTDLAASGATTSSITLTWTAPGDDGNTGTAASYDIRYSDEYPISSESVWNGAALASGEPAPQAAGSVQTFTVTGLTPGRAYWFALKTSDEAPNVSGLSNSPNLSTLPSPDTTAPATITTLALSGATTSSITLTWTAPGDDGNTGTAAYYDIHYSTVALDAANFESGTHASGEPAPAVAGTVQTMTVSGLAPNTTYYFAMKTADEVPNVSAISNVPSLATLPSADTTAPAAITTLALSGATASSITLTWTAPGDDGNTGTASSYDVRYSLAAINGNWASATQASGEPAPAIAGTVQTMTVSGLAPNTTYYFAMKTADEVPNVSVISNVPSLATLSVPDTAAPAAITTLTVSGTTADSATLTWTAPGDDGSTGTATSYDLRYATSSILSNDDFAAATQASGEPAPQIAGTVQTVTVSGLTSGSTYFFAIKTSDEVPNVSALSNVPSAAPGAPAGSASSTGGSGTDLVLRMSASPSALPAEGGIVTFSYAVVNKGSQHIDAISVQDDLGVSHCAPVALTSGDTDMDGLLDTESRETWVFTCAKTVTASETHTAAAHGYWNFGLGTSNSASASVLVGATAASANVHFHARPFPAVLHPGGGVSTIEYHAGNLGETPITDIRFSGDFCTLSELLKGDTNANGKMETNEHWEYLCTGTFTESQLLTVVFSGMAGDVPISDVARIPIDVGMAEPHANIHLHVYASPARLPVGGGTSVLTYVVFNDGNVPLSDIDLDSGSASCATPKHESGDAGADGILGVGERWLYSCIERLHETEVDAPSVHGHAGDLTVTDDAIFVIPVSAIAPPETDPSVEGEYDPEIAREATPDIDTNLSLSPAPTSACVPGVNYKLPSDGDAETQHDSTVYYCGRDGALHAFPNRKIYMSWYPDFLGVRMMDETTLAMIPQGAPVTYRPGFRLVKMQNDSRTYAVARGGVLRWVQDEAAAAALYGSAWNAKVDDLSESFFSEYHIGTNVLGE